MSGDVRTGHVTASFLTCTFTAMLKLRYKHFREDVWRLARDKSGNVCNFAKRQQARQYRRNHIPTAEFVQIAPVDEAKPQWKDIDESPV